MDTGRPIATLAAYEVRPGRRVLVIGDLSDLRGPVSGMVELPLRLFWSSADRMFDLDDPFMLRWVYQTVLREAVRAEELARYLNSDRLVEVWRELVLPAGVRRAWEEQHPVVRVPAVPAA
jgi:hypothetical protein